MTRARRPLAAAALALAPVLVLAGCGGGSSSTKTDATARLDPANWASVQKAARGQTVNWYMYGGEEPLNSFVNGYVAGRLKKRGVTLNQVKINDTVEAVNKVLGEKQAGKKNGSVDMIWINGENFATGVQAKLWYCGYPAKLPNSKYIDYSDPALANDFGLPVRGCETPWQRTTSVLVYNPAKLGAGDVTSVASLFAWAKRHPGRFTYPAPPDFTGSMAVRTFFYDAAGGPQQFLGGFDRRRYTAPAAKLWDRLNALEPSLWRRGTTYPAGQPDVTKLFNNGEIDAYLTYDSTAVQSGIDQGTLPKGTRSAVFTAGNIGNYSYTAIPADAAHKAAAMLLANELISPAAQLVNAGGQGAGFTPVLVTSRLDAADQARFRSLPQPPSQVPLDVLAMHTLPEVSSAYVTALEKDWKANVLQK